MKDIKLIVTDMDGTFLNSRYEMSEEFTAIYEELKARNIKFVPASGRQMPAITKYFTEQEEEMGFIAENGGYVIYQNQELFVDQLDPRYILDIILTVRRITGARAVLSAKKMAYYETNDQEFIKFFTKFYTKNKKVEDLTEQMDDAAFKIAVYHPNGAEKNLYPYLKQFEKYNLEVVVSGEFWLDIMNKNINKGIALEKMQEFLNVTPEQTMAFGDYMNDIQMLENAEYSFAMENAHPEVKKVATYQAKSNDNFGVLQIIKNYLDKSSQN